MHHVCLGPNFITVAYCLSWFGVYCMFQSVRYEKQLQAEEEAYQQARRRLYQEVQDEKERLANQASRQRQEMDKLQRQLEDSHSSSGEVMRKEYEKAREEQERRHQVGYACVCI